MGIATARRTMIKSYPIVIMELKISKPLSIDRPFDILPKSPRRSPSEDSIIARIIVFQKMILQTLSKNALTFGDFLNKIQKMQTRTRTKTTIPRLKNNNMLFLRMFVDPKPASF